jgi:hypothetical protein
MDSFLHRGMIPQMVCQYVAYTCEDLVKESAKVNIE